MRSLRELSTIGLVDGRPELEFDQAVQLVSRLLGCEISLFSVIDTAGDRQVFKAETGLPEPLATIRETPLSHSFCKTVVAEASIVRVNDARQDERFRENPSVDEHGVIAYLGLPVETAPGEPVGALCAISSSPRTWTDPEVEVMQTLAATVSAQVQLRLALHDQRRVTAELELTNQRFRDLAANVPGAIFRYVLHPDGRDEVEYMSPGCVDIWEVSADEIRESPRHLWDIILPEDVEGMQASIRRSAELLVPWKHQWRVETRSGRKKWLQGHAQPKRLDRGGVVWNSLILDVTVEVQAREKLRESDRMLAEAQKQEIIGRLAGGVAHDFNNLLAIIHGNAEILLSGTATEPPRSYLSEIMHAARRGSDLTRSLLSFARRSELKPVVIRVNEAVEAMQQLLRRTLPQNIAIVISSVPGLWQVRADLGALESALLNLVLNACDAMPKGGTLSIEMANVDISEDYIAAHREEIPPGRYVMLAVSDTGTGMTADVLARAFEPFFTTKETDKGSGLGLAMVQGFARQSNGAVFIYSEPGHGTSVKLYLRASDEEAALPPAMPAARIDAVGGRILLVEDNEAVRRTVRWTLEGAGYTVLEAASGDAAMAMLDDGCGGFDLVLTDVVMPGRLQGPELVHRIRDRRPDVPVIFMSGYPHEANVHGNGIRASDISLMKPFSRSDLLACLTQSLQRAGAGQG